MLTTSMSLMAASGSMGMGQARFTLDDALTRWSFSLFPLCVLAGLVVLAA